MEEELAKKQERERLLQEAMKSSLFQDILFDYDSYIIKTDDFPKLNDITNWLKKHKDIKIVVEGHCDERGTIEYNLALGQKRAEAVKDYLGRFGIEEKRIKTISYGKEIPVDPGHTEEAWAKNRRAHFRIE
ncbi:MAG TPA: peptidoglycan-associated lipoprotein Pal [Deltaproteobacteria bacterium]|nr:peptidoglycan-associated lipoprotein Pal [Deltaproteobacteria bacterium]